VDWIHLIITGTDEGCYEHGSEHLWRIKDAEFCDQLRVISQE
jgi:hypothetical protein